MTGAGATELESTRVTRLLRNDIMSGRRPPGARLVERDIAAELNVSRLPVREAIRMLVAEGVVVSKPRSWATVREFTEQDIQDYSEVRDSLETLIFVLAAQRHDEQGLARIRAVLDDEAEAARAGDLQAGRIAAGTFHELVVTLAANEMLTELVTVFATRLRWLFGQHEDLATMVAEHERIYLAIVARDVDAIRELVPAHLERGRRDAQRRLRATQEAAG